MITSKRRAALRREANGLETIFQIGKGGLDAELIEGIGGALAARELIKIRVLDTCELTAREASDEVGSLNPICPSVPTPSTWISIPPAARISAS